MLSCRQQVILISLVYSVATLCCFYVYICHASVVANSLPENFSLIVAYVYAMYVCACVLTFLHHAALSQNRSRSKQQEHDAKY